MRKLFLWFSDLSSLLCELSHGWVVEHVTCSHKFSAVSAVPHLNVIHVSIYIYIYIYIYSVCTYIYIYIYISWRTAKEASAIGGGNPRAIEIRSHGLQGDVWAGGRFHHVV